MASAGYPGSYAKGKAIRGLELAARSPNTKVFHAGTTRAGDEIITNGGRVLGVTSWAPDLRAARDAAYAAVAQIHFEGAQYRRDITAKVIAK
jgi:phosphoribosylamine--glycine ligase